MKPPKNFYSNLDRRKQGLPEVPEASAADAGKVIKVGEDGAYELGEDAGSVLPEIDPETDNLKLIQVYDGEYALTTQMGARSFVVTDANSKIAYTQGISFKAIESQSGSISFVFLGKSASINTLTNIINNFSYDIHFRTKENETFIGFLYSATVSSVTGIVRRVSDNAMFNIVITSSSYNLTPIGTIKYYEITSSGSSVSLPSGVTFAEVYAELQAGIDVKFTSGARVFSVTSFESTNIRAHWMTDLDLTSMEVYVINIASDGTGTVASATFSGS